MSNSESSTLAACSTGIAAIVLGEDSEATTAVKVELPFSVPNPEVVLLSDIKIRNVLSNGPTPICMVYRYIVARNIPARTRRGATTNLASVILLDANTIGMCTYRVDEDAGGEKRND